MINTQDRELLLKRVAGFLSFAKDAGLARKDAIERCAHLYTGGDLKRAKRLITEAEKGSTDIVKQEPTPLISVVPNLREGRGVKTGGVVVRQ